jgi:hypothetical protein
MASKLKLCVHQLVELIVAKKYDDVVALTAGRRLPSDQIQAAMDGYGRTLVMPPEIAFDNLDVIPIRNSNPPMLSVRMNLWSVEEGESDLSVELTVTVSDGGCRLELDDIHVL